MCLYVISRMDIIALDFDFSERHLLVSYSFVNVIRRLVRLAESLLVNLLTQSILAQPTNPVGRVYGC